MFVYREGELIRKKIQEKEEKEIKKKFIELTEIVTANKAEEKQQASSYEFPEIKIISGP